MDYFTYLLPTEALNDIYQEMQRVLPEAARENEKKLVSAWKAVCIILYTVEEEGLLALEDKLNCGELQRVGTPNYDFLHKILLLCVDAHDTSIILDMMVNDYYVNDYGDVDKAVLFLYMVCILEFTARDEEYEMRYSADTLVQWNLSLFSEECSAPFAEVWEERFRILFISEDCSELPFDWEGLLQMHGGRGKAANGDMNESGDDWDPLLKISSRDIRRVWEQKKEMFSNLVGIDFEKNLFQICKVLSHIHELAYGARHQGLKFVENMAEQLENTGDDLDLFFREAVLFLCEGNLDVRYRMMEKYEELERNPWEDFIRILYVEAVYMIWLGVNPALVFKVCIGMLPAGKREQCRKIVEKK